MKGEDTCSAAVMIPASGMAERISLGSDDDDDDDPSYQFVVTLSKPNGV